MHNKWDLDVSEETEQQKTILVADGDTDDLAGLDVGGLSDRQLRSIVAAANFELQQRALEACDPAALIEEGFSEGFDSKGMPFDPYLVGEVGSGILVCMGTRIDKSTTSHDCSFVSVDDGWIWEADDLIEEEIRNPAGPKPVMRSVSLLPAYEGLKFDLVQCVAKMSVHQVKKVRSYEIQSGKVVLVETRTPKVTASR